MGLETGIWVLKAGMEAWRLGLRDWDFGVATGIRVWQLRLGLRGWEWGLATRIGAYKMGVGFGS